MDTSLVIANSDITKKSQVCPLITFSPFKQGYPKRDIRTLHSSVIHRSVALFASKLSDKQEWAYAEGTNGVKVYCIRIGNRAILFDNMNRNSEQGSYFVEMDSSQVDQIKIVVGYELELTFADCMSEAQIQQTIAHQMYTMWDSYYWLNYIGHTMLVSYQTDCPRPMVLRGVCRLARPSVMSSKTSPYVTLWNRAESTILPNGAVELVSQADWNEWLNVDSINILALFDPRYNKAFPGS